jgi:hypothetical protein
MPRAFGITNTAPYASAPAVGAAGDTYWNTAGKVLYVSDGTTWIATGPGTGGPPSGAAGGDLGAAGSTYPNPVIANGAVTTAKIAVDAVDGTKLTSPYAVRVLGTSGQVITSDILVILSWATSETSYGLTSGFLGGGADRLVVPKTGFYLIGGEVDFATTATATMRLVVLLQLNGTTIGSAECGGGAPRSVAVSTGKILTAGQYVQLVAYQNSGAGVAMATAPLLWMARVG